MRPPWVYAPQGDSRLLTEALRGAAVPPGARVLDLCTGTGVVAMAAARLGASEVHAVDVSRAAVATARLNARLHRLPVTVHRGDPLGGPPDTARSGPFRCAGRFDVVTANPPYVPSPPSPRAGRGRARAWDAGPDGRAYLDRLCAAAPRLLSEDGILLIVHSALCGPAQTLRALEDAGLKAAVTARRVQPFGPVLRARAGWLAQRGLIGPGEREEELVVVRGDLVTRGG